MTKTYTRDIVGLSALLTDADMTVATAGKLLDVSPRTVFRWLSGDFDIPYASWYVLHHQITGRVPPRP